MATPQSERLAIAPSPSTTRTPPASARDLRTPLGDDVIWKRLREAGFDEESIKRRDKAALIAYIAKLEAEIYDHQHHMGLLILERKEWVSKYEKIEAAAESAEILYKREQAAHSSAVAEGKKREEKLKKDLGIEKECVANIEKALHEMRAECAETKVSADNKLAEAQSMMENALKKLTEAEAKFHAAESLEAEASRYHRAAERKLHEVESREDDLRRRIVSFKSDCDCKEKEMLLERQSLSERLKTLQQSQERLLDGQALLNQREEFIFNRSQDLNNLEKELEASKSNIEKELRALSEEKMNLELKTASLVAREETVVKKEYELSKKEDDLLTQQQKFASKESEKIRHIMANHETSLKLRKSELEAELEMKRKSVEEEIEVKRRAWELREVDLHNREDLISEKEHDLESQVRMLADKEKDLTERLSSIEEKEKRLVATEREVELKKVHLQKEQEDTDNKKLELQKLLGLLEQEKKQIHHVEEKVEAIKNETNELTVLEKRLKDEIDIIRAEKLQIEVEADELKAEKAKFEIEWELIDEKREELHKEAERVANERLSISNFLKDEHDNLKREKDALRDQYKLELESLSREREAFMHEMEHERSEWYSKIQKERADFLLDIEMQKRELENRVDKRREEIENYLREKERVFDEEKKKELQDIASLREIVVREMEHANLELKRLDRERIEISLDHEKRDKEWAELNISIEELKVQRQKLEKQRELLHADREEILADIENLKQLEDLKTAPDHIAAHDVQLSDKKSSKQKFSEPRILRQHAELGSGHQVNDDYGSTINMSAKKGLQIVSPPISLPFSWLKRCADSLVEQTQSNKKRKQQTDVSATQSEAFITPCMLSTQPNTPVDEHPAMSLNQIPVTAKETTVYIDKIITVQEVTSIDGTRITGNGQEITFEKSEEKLEDYGGNMMNSDETGKIES